MKTLLVLVSLLSFHSAAMACVAGPTEEIDNRPGLKTLFNQADSIVLAKVVVSGNDKSKVVYLQPSLVIKGHGKKIKVGGLSTKTVDAVIQSKKRKMTIINSGSVKPSAVKVYKNKPVYVNADNHCRYHSLLYVEGSQYLVFLFKNQFYTVVIDEGSNKHYVKLKQYLSTKS